MEIIEIIVDAIVLIAAGLAAINTIATFMGKPINFLKKIRGKEIEEIFENKFQLELRNVILPKLEEIKNINLEQSKQIEILTKSSKDILQESIMEIYHRRKKYATLTIYDKEALEQYYEDYKAQNGNHHVDRYYKRMAAWPVIFGDEEE